MTVSVFDKLYLILLGDLRTGVRYRGGFWMEAFGTLAELASFFFLARAIGGGYRPQGMDYYSFLLVGTSVFGFLLTGVNTFVSTVRQAQITGTMEVLMTTATPGWVIIVLTAVSSFAARLLPTALYLAVGMVLFRAPVESPNLGSALLIVALSVLVAVAVGMLAAAMQVALQRGGGVTVLMGAVAWFLGGIMFPVSALPPLLQSLSYAIPFTYSIHGLRVALITGGSFRELSTDVLALALFAAVLLPAGVGAFSLALRRARLQGTLSFY